MNTLPSYLTIATFGTSASKIQPDPTTYSGGYLAGQRFPAQHENYFMNGLTGNGNTLITQVNSIQNELNNWLAYFSVTPSGADTQIRDLFNTRMALKLDSSAYTAADVLSKLLTVDADNAGINATTLKSITIGQSGASYIPYVDASQNTIINSTGFLAVGSPGVYNAAETVIAGRRAQAGKSVIEIDNQNSGAGAYSGFRLDSFGSAWDILTGSTAANSNALDFNNGSVRMRITSGGNVLVGTTTDGTGKVQIVKSVTVSNPATMRSMKFGVDSNDNYALYIGYGAAGGAASGGVLQSLDNGSGSPLFLNPSGGSVLIGNTTGTYHLDVRSPADNQFSVIGEGTGWGGTTLARIYTERNTAYSAATLLQVGSAYNIDMFRVMADGKVFVSRGTDDGSGAVLQVNGGISGVGTALTALNASNLGSGTVPLARLSGITSSEMAAGSRFTSTNGGSVTGTVSIPSLAVGETKIIHYVSPSTATINAPASGAYNYTILPYHLYPIPFINQSFAGAALWSLDPTYPSVCIIYTRLT